MNRVSFNRKVAQLAAAAGMSVAVFLQQAHAAGGIDVTAATGGIADAATALGALIAALMTLSVGLFGVVKVYRFLSKKAGG